MVETFVTIYLAIIIALSLLVGFSYGRIVEMRRTERILRYMMDEAINQMPVTLVEGEEDDAEG